MSAAVATAGTSSSRIAALVPVVLVSVVLLMVVPIPAVLLDLLLAVSIAISLALLLVSISIEKPLELSVFPTLLLFTTLLRLALNVASTRLILLKGGEGTTAAGRIIQAFGEFIIGGNYVVGAAVFLLLVIINFVVITKGAGRVAEVSARFTLDAMPGKQMSIDADLAAGVITQQDAKLRRRAVEQESEFFGAMDGASKFIRGDAVAALLVTGINIVVGFVVGVLQQGMAPAQSAATYTVLAVGDGLASQIPALLVSTAAAVVVTRVSGDMALSPSVVQQLGRRQPALYGTAGLLAMMGMAPGMPALPFLVLAGGLVYAARNIAAAKASAQVVTTADGSPGPAAPTERQQIEQLMPIDLLELEVGIDLVPLVDASRGGELVERIGAIRRNLAMELGLIIPSVHIRDNLRLRPGGYRLLLSGNEIGEGDLRVGRLLAMDPTGGPLRVAGEDVREPAFGLPARWISAQDREAAENAGLTVVDGPTVAATHLTELLRGVAQDLLGRSEAQELVDLFAKQNPRLVDELIPNLLSLGEVIRVLRNLLSEHVSVRDMRSILECLADHARDIKDVDELTERVRQRLSRQITARFRGSDGRVAAMVLDPRIEDALRSTGTLDAGTSQRVLSAIDGMGREFSGLSTPPVIVCAPDVRRLAAGFLGRRVQGLSVISYREVESKTTVRVVGMVGG